MAQLLRCLCYFDKSNFDSSCFWSVTPLDWPASTVLSEVNWVYWCWLIDWERVLACDNEKGGAGRRVKPGTTESSSLD